MYTLLREQPQTKLELTVMVVIGTKKNVEIMHVWIFLVQLLSQGAKVQNSAAHKTLPDGYHLLTSVKCNKI